MFNRYSKIILIHGILWLIFFAIIAYGFTINLDVIMTTTKGTTQMDFRLLPFRLELYGIIFKIAFFYAGVFYIFPKLFKKKPKIIFLMAFIASLLFFYIVETFILRTFVIGEMFSKNAFTIKSYTYFLYRVNPLMYLILTILIFIYFFITEWMYNEKNRGLVKQEQLKTELELLRYQINPHFLFNTLNNFYSIAQEKKVSSLETGILKLSKLMRYNLYESNHDTVLLSKEIEYINNYISIYQFKFDKKDNFELKLTVNGEPGTKNIVPFLFLPLVENALKHGFRYNKACFVRIQIDIKKDYLELNAVNSLHSENKAIKDSYGIGLFNVQKRLALIYPGQYTFETKESDNTFSAYLKVPLHEH